MTSTRTPDLAAEPFGLLALLVVRRREHALTSSLSESETRAFAFRISDLFRVESSGPDVTLAVLGQPYLPEQLLHDRVLSRFACQARALTMRATHGCQRPLVLPVAPGPLLPLLPLPCAPQLDPTEPPTATGFTRVIGFPCAVIGPRVTLAHLCLPSPPQSLPCPALATCVAGPLQVQPSHVLLFTLQRPPRIASRVTHWLSCLRRAEDLADATTRAQTLSTPVRATVACYGTAGTMAYLTLTIQDAGTLQVLRTYRYRASHFPEGGREADDFFQELCFAWGAVDYLLVPTLQPVQLDATGTLIPHRLRLAHRTAAVVSSTAVKSH